jgi:hypothetical protein
MIPNQPQNQHQHQPGNGASPNFQQGRSPLGGQQPRDYNNEFENGQLGHAQSAHMRGSFQSPDNGQMAPPAPLSQNSLAMVNHAHPANNSFAMLQSPVQPFQPDFVEMDAESVDPTTFSGPGELQGFKVVPNPPHLDYWRDRLFNVDELITLSEDEYADTVLGVYCATNKTNLIAAPLQIQHLLSSR